MTISSTTTKVSYAGNGSTTVFAYTFKIFADADLEVIVRSSTGTETTKSLTTHYTVSGAGTDSGGNVTFGSAPASGETVVIRRNLGLTQGTDYVENDPFPADSHEDALDRLTMITQGIQEELDRSIKASKTNTISSTEFAIGASDRANKIFAFDGSGDLSVTQELGTFVGNWSASTDYNARDIVKDTSTNNIFLCNTSHTSSGSQPLTTNTDSAKWDLLVDAASATTASTSASSSATAAAASAAAASTSASNASTSETNSAASATSATTAKNASETAQTAAETAQAAAETAQAAAETAETNSGTSATASAASATSAASSASSASSSSASASASATSASSSASTATTQAGIATTKSGEASTSASNAATSETNAATSASAAAAAQAAAELAADNFDDTYLGAKASDPTVDNDGDALTAGDLYFNTTSNELKVYNGSAWQVAAVSTSGLLTASNNLSDLASAATARTNLGVAIGSDVQAFDSDILKADTTDELAVGYTSANSDAGTKSSGTFTPDPRTSNFQHAVNGGAHTLAPPDYNCTMVILYKNNASAGAVTTSGFTLVDGDDLTTTNGDEFFMYITRYNDGSTTFSALTVKALQ